MERNIFKQDKIENIINQGYMHNIPPTTSDQTKTILSQLENNICKILIKNVVGTGFFCKIPHPDEFKLLPVLITNNHILNEEDLEINKNIKIAINNEVKIIVINESRLVYTSKEFDATIIEIKPEDKIKKFLEIDENIFDNDYLKIYKKNTVIYTLQYPKGIVSSHSIGKICQMNKHFIIHDCSTDFGSSGSPILLLSNFKVIGIHKGEINRKINGGIFIKYPIEDFNKKYPINISKNDSNTINNEYSKDINDKSENNENKNYLEKYKDDILLGNDEFYNFLDNFEDKRNDNIDLYNNMEYDNFNNNYIDSNNNNQERNNNIYNREIHANNYKIQSKYNQTQKNAPNNKKVDVIICSSCYSKKICCLCKNYSKNLFTITQSLKAHSMCMKDKTCCICGHYGSGSHSIRICEICKKGRGKDIRSTKCFVCFNYLLV